MAPSDATHPNRADFPSGLAGPSLRALHTAGIHSLRDLRGWTEHDLAALHGMGPKALATLRQALAAANMSFKL